MKRASLPKPALATVNIDIPAPADAGSHRRGVTVQDIKRSFQENLHLSLGRSTAAATPQDLYTALALTVRDRVHDRGVGTIERCMQEDSRAVAYLSAEYLPGPHT